MFGFGDPSTTDDEAKKRDLYARLFDRLAGANDPNAPYQMDDASKHHSVQRGLLQLAAAFATPNGGNFARSLSSGLLAGSNTVNDAQAQYSNDAYRNDIMKRTQTEMAANTAKTTAAQQFVKPDGTFDYSGYAGWMASHGDPTAAMDMQDKARKMGVHEYGEPTYVKTADGKFEDPYVLDKTSGQFVPMSQALGGQQQAAPQGAPAGGAPIVMGNALADAVQGVESGGNPFAVSPKGALGPMQTMPGTLRDPGFGVQPARDSTPQEQARVGRDYLAALTGKYGTQGGLAAYNMGPGAWQASLGKYGSPDAALAHAPAETQAYVPKVLARAGQPMGAPQAPTGPVPFGRRAVKEPAEDGPKLGQDERWADAAHTRAEPIPGGALDPNSSGLDPDAVRQAAMDWIFNGKSPPAGRNGGSAVYKQVSNARTQIAKEYGISPMQVSTQAGRVKAAQKALAVTQQRSALLTAQMKTVDDNAAYALSIAKTMPRSQYPIVNKYLQSGKAFLGDPQTTKFITALNSVQTEYAKAMSGATGAAGSTDSAMAHARTLINNGMANGQLEAAIAAMKTEMANQRHNYEGEMFDLSSRMDQLTPADNAPAVWVRDASGKLVRGH